MTPDGPPPFKAWTLRDVVDVDFPAFALRTYLEQAGVRRFLAEASGGRFFRPESMPGSGFEMALGSYRRSFRIDPRRAAWVYAAIALLAGLEWFLRRRRGML